uniref:Fucolectin tachylectin-4 pentraxin-1 domain-containing protein n=1 Tax=Sarcophilus harrisii TaxID=9305 RepID=A0A7N4PGG0_SARHA
MCSPSGSPERAVDGSLLSDFEKGTCIHTRRESHPWWMVDLGSSETVKSVAITPRKDCCMEELYGAFILVGDSSHNGGTFNDKCAVIGSLGYGKTEFFRCGMMRGRYVSIVNPKRTFLSFCEVRVFGKTSEAVSPSVPSQSQPSSLKARDDTNLPVATVFKHCKRLTPGGEQIWVQRKLSSLCQSLVERIAVENT